jgi:hypothetical protein
VEISKAVTTNAVKVAVPNQAWVGDLAAAVIKVATTKAAAPVADAAAVDKT